MYTTQDEVRERKLLAGGLPPEPYRSPYNRDYARLLHAPSFRRLQGKTQLFPGQETDFFRNRLTHSLEVAQICEAITGRVNYFLKEAGHDLIDPVITRFAGLAHDLGHPPFGHLGEEVLNWQMAKFGGFEGNAQTLRLLARIEKKELDDYLRATEKDRDERVGLNLTYRSLASILKYDHVIPRIQETENDAKPEPIKGYYDSEEELVRRIKAHVAPGFEGVFKTVECQIMDLADDIAYSVYDLEDALKAGFICLLDVISAPGEVWVAVSKRVNAALAKEARVLGREAREVSPSEAANTATDLFMKYLDPVPNDKISREQYIKKMYNVSEQYSADGHLRTGLSSQMVGKLIREVSVEYNPDFPAMTRVWLSEPARINVEIFKQFTWQYQILSNRLRIVAHRGIEIVSTLFEEISDDKKKGPDLMPNDYKMRYNSFQSTELRMRTICDFIAGMTDRYALEFYARLRSENAETIFKPIF